MLNIYNALRRSSDLFVKYLYVNGGQLPTNSPLPPDLARKKKFCTFADVEEYPVFRIPQRPRVAAFSAKYKIE